MVRREPLRQYQGQERRGKVGRSPCASPHTYAHTYTHIHIHTPEGRRGPVHRMRDARCHAVWVPSGEVATGARPRAPLALTRRPRHVRLIRHARRGDRRCLLTTLARPRVALASSAPASGTAGTSGTPGEVTVDDRS